jgi:hypothetical protein
MGSVVAVFLMFERWLWASGLMFYKKPGLKDIAYRVVGLFHAKIEEWLAIKGAWLHADWICKHWCLLISSLTSTHSFSVIYLHWLSSKHKVLERERERQRERETEREREHAKHHNISPCFLLLQNCHCISLPILVCFKIL